MAEMPTDVKEILEEVKYFQDAYFTFDQPVPFNGIMLYPVPVKHYNEFLSCSAVCTLNKNDDFKGMKMTHLEYILRKMTDAENQIEAVMWSMRFNKIIELCLHVQNGLKCPKCGKFMTYEEYIQKAEAIEGEDKSEALKCECGGVFEEVLKYRTDEQTKKPILIIDGHEFDSRQYNKLRKYILYQNLPDYKDDSWVDKAIRDDEAAKAEIMSRQNGGAEASLERKIVGLCVNLGYTLEQTENLTMRKFIQLLGMIDDVMNYKITKQGLMSGLVSLKDGSSIEHWLYRKESDSMYGKAVDASAYVSQLSQS